MDHRIYGPSEPHGPCAPTLHRPHRRPGGASETGVRLASRPMTCRTRCRCCTAENTGHPGEKRGRSWALNGLGGLRQLGGLKARQQLLAGNAAPCRPSPGGDDRHVVDRLIVAHPKCLKHLQPAIPDRSPNCVPGHVHSSHRGTANAQGLCNSRCRIELVLKHQPRGLWNASGGSYGSPGWPCPCRRRSDALAERERLPR